MKLVISCLVSQFPQNLSVPRETVSVQSPVTQVVQDVPEMCAISVDEDSPVRFRADIVTSAEHGSQHRLRILGQGQT